MDTCQLFNFLFGTRRATAELSRCFAQIGQNLSPKRARKRSSQQEELSPEGGGSSTNPKLDNQQSQPSSPLRQLQQKLHGYASSLNSSASSSRKGSQQDGLRIPTESITSEKTSTKLPASAELPSSQAGNDGLDGRGNSESQPSLTGTYRAHLIKSLSFDENGELKIYDLIDGIECQNSSCNQQQQHRARPICLRGTTSLCKPKNKSIVVSTTNYKPGVEQDQKLERLSAVGNGNGDEFEESDFDSLSSRGSQSEFERNLSSFEDRSLDGSSRQMNLTSNTIKRVVLYGDKAEEELESGSQRQQPIISSAEIYNIVSEAGEFGQGSRELRKERSLSIQHSSDSGQKELVDLVAERKLVGSSEQAANDKQQTDEASCRQQASVSSSRPSTTGAAKRSAYHVRNLIKSFEEQQQNQSGWLTTSRWHEDEFGSCQTSTSLGFDPIQSQETCRSSSPPAPPLLDQLDEQLAKLDLAPSSSYRLERRKSALLNHQAGGGKPFSLVKPLPPKPLPKTNKAKFLTIQLSLNKATRIEELFHDESFLSRLFHHLDPLDRCNAAQVCRQWRDILYSEPAYWKDLVCVIDYTHLRREYLVECIVNTLQSAKLRGQMGKQDHGHGHGSQLQFQQQLTYSSTQPSLSASLTSGYRSNSTRSSQRSHADIGTVQLATLEAEQPEGMGHSLQAGTTRRDQEAAAIRSNRASDDSTLCSIDSISVSDIDQDDMWRIQELCNRFTSQRSAYGHLQIISRCPTQTLSTSDMSYGMCPNEQASPLDLMVQQHQCQMDTHHQSSHHNHLQQTSTNHHNQCTASQSSSIPSQISSTLSSVSISSILSPLSEYSRIESMKGKLYESMERRQFEAISLVGATNDDTEDLFGRLSKDTLSRISLIRLNNCFLTDQGLETFLEAFSHLEELELCGCNEISNTIDLSNLSQLRALSITDCINISDGIAFKLVKIFPNLDELVLQAYHLSDCFTDYLGIHSDASKLKRLELPNCKSITNRSLISIVKYYTGLMALSVSGSKIDDEGIEILSGGSQNIQSLDLSWCPGITDLSLECIACDLADCLIELIIDRNANITDHGLIYLTRMKRLELLHVRWCPRISDVGLEAILRLSSLNNLSLAGLRQLSTRSLCNLTATNLTELELTNCPAVTSDLKNFLIERMPYCNITF